MTKEQNIFSNGNPPEIGIGKHNVGSGVLRESDSATVNRIDAIYGARLGHLPNATGQHIALIEARHQSYTTRLHLQYLSSVYGVRIEQMTSQQINALPGSKLVVPYINTADVDTVNGHNTRRWGLPRPIVDALKDKAQSHRDMLELQTPDITPVNFIVTSADEMNTDAHPFIAQIAQGYEEHGLESVYPVGLMIRPHECDGGYGNAVLEQTNHGISFTPDGDTGRTEHFETWEGALKAANKHVRSSTTHRNPEVVMSRLIDVEESPGMTVLMIDGQPHSLGWNGQLMHDHSKACVGTTTFTPRTHFSQRVKDDFEIASAEALSNHVHAVARKHGIDLKGTRGLVNVDLMIPGQLEREYLLRSGQNTRTIYVAEFNPRWTNSSDATAAVVWATSRNHTAGEYQRTVERGLLAIDKEIVPPRCTEERYQRALTINDRLRKEGDGVILRMPGNATIGVIYHGNVQRARSIFLENI